jgi:hypothetical protein
MVEAHLDQTAQKPHAEGEPVDKRRKPWTEPERVTVVPHAAEPVDSGEPGTRERTHVDPVADVVLQVGEVHQRRLAEVVVRQLQVPHLSGQDRLSA